MLLFFRFCLFRSSSLFFLILREFPSAWNMSSQRASDQRSRVMGNGYSWDHAGADKTHQRGTAAVQLDSNSEDVMLASAGLFEIEYRLTRINGAVL